MSMGVSLSGIAEPSRKVYHRLRALFNRWRCDMARDGFLILDSDLHMMEPDDLWARYLEGPYRASLPRFFGGQQQKLSDSPEDKVTPIPSWGWRCRVWRFPRMARRRPPPRP